MDTAMFSTVVFFASSAISACLLYKCSRKEEWRERWFPAAPAFWGTLGFLVFLTGFFSGSVATMVVGTVMALGYTSLYLTSYVESEHRVKRGLEVVFLGIALGVVVYGYAITGSLILAVITLFIVVVLSVAFVLSYLLPRIRRKSKLETYN